jgi:Holliday junction resolvasome RuvABC endonuclease subunit
MTKILGFDCSSSTIGYSLLEINNNQISLVSTNFIKPPKKGDLISRLANTRDQILSIINQANPDQIAIEDIIAFMKGQSTAKTIIMLTTFNRMISLLSYDYLSAPPSFYNVMSIRHGLKLNKVFPKKEEIPDLVAHHLNIPFPYLKNKNNKLIVENYDMADSIAVALYHAFILTNKIKVKK